MVRIIFLCTCILTSVVARTQSVAINSTGATASSSSIMDVSSTTKGILIPRMSKTEKYIITTPANGLLIFQNGPDSIGFHYYDGIRWIWLVGSNIVDTLSWKRAGNSGTNPSINFLGTTDNQPLQLRLNNTWAGAFNAITGNYSIGTNALRNNNGIKSIAIGSAALQNIAFPTRTIAFGDSAGYNIGTSNASILIGSRAGYNGFNGSTGSNAIIIGTNAGISTFGDGSVVMGSNAAKVNTTSGNIFIGRLAGENNTIGISTFIGPSSGNQNTTGNLNIAIGEYSLSQNSTGNNNMALGSYAAYLNNVNNNIAIGTDALRLNNLGSANIAIGVGSLKTQNGISALKNVAIGDSAAVNLSLGTSNTLIGTNVFKDKITGNRNTVIGHSAMALQTSGNDNTAVGDISLLNTSGNFNTAIGKSSGVTNNIGNRNTFIGASTDVLLSNTNNATAIGFAARVDTSDAIVLGSITGIGNGSANANVGIGVTKPFKATLNVARNTLNGTTLGIFGEGQAGISLQQNFATIGWNQYRDNADGNLSKYMASGWALNNAFNHTNGSIVWNMSTIAGAANDYIPTEATKMTLTNNAFLGLGNVGGLPWGNVHIENTIANRKVILWQSPNNDHQYFGFGIEPATLRYAVAGTGDTHKFYAGTSTTTSNLLFTIFGNGNATLAGTLTQLSDSRLKKNIYPLPSTLTNITKLNAYTYNWKDDTKDTQPQIGVLAQEVQKIYPQLVKEDDKGNLSVNYSGFTPILLESVKELNKKVEAQQLQINELKLLIEQKLK